MQTGENYNRSSCALS